MQDRHNPGRLATLGAAILITGTTMALAAGPNPVREGPRWIDPAKHGVGRLVADLKLTDIDGKTRRLGDFKRHTALVIALTDTTCPLAAKYLPRLSRLEKHYGTKNVAFLFVNSSTVDTSAEIRTVMSRHHLTSPYVHDPDAKVERALGAMTSTEVFVLDRSRTLRYRGAIDDQYGFGYTLQSPRVTYLTDALEAVLTSKEPPVKATWAPGCELDHEPGKPSTAATKVTYHNRISRIVQSHCLECHREGGIGPFSLETYDDLDARRGMIRRVVERGIMPPWFASKGGASWKNDRSLGAADKADLLSWLREGLPEGDPKHAPVPRVFPTNWQIGKPDVVLQLPQPIAVPAEGVMPYQIVRVPTTFPQDRWVKAMEVRPSARKAVHHVLVFVLPGPNTPRRPGRSRFDRAGNFAAYVPGNSYRIYPDGLARRLPAGATLLFQLHYTPNGTATEDRTELGLVFSDEPPRHEVRTFGIYNRRLRIPPHADRHEVSAQVTVPFDAHILSLMPHMHLRGTAFRYILEEPDIRSTRLLEVPNYDFNWQLAYQFAEPLPVKRGNRIRVSGWFDNSAAN
ncbi:MAG: redoxin family protein, partial [Phycisphaerae bacterium]|nr:redoxin family protein [Phycisphaerae bacterium]